MVSGLCPPGTVSPSGLPRPWRSSRLHAETASVAAASRHRLARKREDIEHASGRSLEREILDCIGEAERGGRVARVELARDDRARPATDPGDDGNILAP